MDKQNSRFHLSVGWIWGKLEDLVLAPRDDIVDGPFGSNLKASSYVERGIPIIRLQNIDRNVFVQKNIRYVSPQKAQQLNRHSFLRGDIVITKLGAPLGKACIVPESIENGIIVADVVRLRIPEQIVSKKYLVYAINSDIAVTQLKRKTKGTTRPRVNLNHIRELSVPIAPLNEQHRIVAKVEELFSFLDAGVEALRKVQTQLKRYRQAVLKYAFEGKLTEEWRRTHGDQIEPAQKLLEQSRGVGKDTKFKELQPIDIIDLPTLPEEWTWARVGEIAESMRNGVYKPKRFYGNNGVACLRMYNIENGVIVWKDVKRMNLTPEEIEFYELKPGDILVNRVNSRELVGKAAAIPSGLERCVYESKNIRLRLLQDYAHSKYVNFWFLMYSQRFFSRNAQQTVGMASINQEQLASMPIPFCHPDEQIKAIEEIERLFSVADEVEKIATESMEHANKMRQSVLKMAFEGKLVPQDPADEPADKLLSRIKAERANSGDERGINKEKSKPKQLELSDYV